MNFNRQTEFTCATCIVGRIWVSEYVFFTCQEGWSSCKHPKKKEKIFTTVLSFKLHILCGLFYVSNPIYIQCMTCMHVYRFPGANNIRLLSIVAIKKEMNRFAEFYWIHGYCLRFFVDKFILQINLWSLMPRSRALELFHTCKSSPWTIHWNIQFQ